MKEIAWNKYKDDDLKKIESISDDYKAYLNSAKTEREATSEIIRRAKEKGFVDLEKFIKDTDKPAARIATKDKHAINLVFIIPPREEIIILW